jgi:hypothetical protein
METLISRIKSSQTEEMKIGKRPTRGEVQGNYKVRRKRDGILSYDVLLVSNNGLSISCSCKDYQKNTLHFCKHSAAIFDLLKREFSYFVILECDENFIIFQNFKVNNIQKHFITSMDQF